MTKAYDIYVFHRSYFCGKMLAYLRYKEIPHRAIYQSLGEVGTKMSKHTGLRQMPVVCTPEGEWLNDTTPMIEWFEQRYPEPSLFPKDPVMAFYTRLLEDYGDEWLWRPAIYHRWNKAEDRFYYKALFPKEFVGGLWGAFPLLTKIGGHLVHRHQRDKFLQGDGITEQNREHVEAVYTGTLERMEAILRKRPYLLGHKPSFADFGFFGSMFWHFSNDPTPNRIMQNQAPGVYEWVARMWNAKASRFSEQEFEFADGQFPDELSPLIQDALQNYLPYLEQNALALQRGDSHFDWKVENYLYPGVHTSPYRTWCRERLARHFQTLSPEDQQRAEAMAEPLGGLKPLLSHPEIRSDWDPEGIAPMCKPGKIPLWYRLKAPFTGTNHVSTRRAWMQ